MRRLGPLYGGMVALVHSTPWRWPLDVGDDARSPGWVVAVALPIGFAAWLVAALAHTAGLPPTVAGALGIAGLSLASAALIERGLADRVDALQRDARTPGVAAILALVFFTLIRVLAFIALPPDRWLGVLVATAVVGRWAAMFLQALGDPILDDQSPRSLVTTPAPAWLTVLLSAGALVIAVLALGKSGVAALAIAAAVAFVLGVDAQRRDHGLTAPVVATAAAVGELCVLLVACSS
jgi:adenosylcobinamide-GDP ribazoletransferase